MKKNNDKTERYRKFPLLIYMYCEDLFAPPLSIFNIVKFNKNDPILITLAELYLSYAESRNRPVEEFVGMKVYSHQNALLFETQYLKEELV